MKRVAAGIIAAALALCACGARSTPRAAATAAPLPSGAALITIHSSHPGRAIPSGFLGLSLEYNAITPYAGTDPHNLNPVFEQLIRNLTPGQAPNLRIGTSRALPVSSPVRWPAQPPAPPSGWPTRGHSWPSGPGSKSVTLHRYPLQECYVAKSQPNYPSVAHLLAPGASAGLADSVAVYARIVHSRHLRLRIDEMNTISCGGGAVGHSFASALWATDALFEMARVGVDGVNLHSYPGAPYDLFTFKRSSHRRWIGNVEPEYYGMLLFAQAAPANSRLLPLKLQHAPGIKAWATKAPDGHVRVLAINERTRTDTVAVKLPGGRTATLERLRAPSLNARGGVTLGGQRIQASTGTLHPPNRVTSVTPRGGAYVIALPGASAALLTL